MNLTEALRRIKALGLTETEAMNLFQGHGKVSDNAVWLHDVARSDLAVAVEWLEGHVKAPS